MFSLINRNTAQSLGQVLTSARRLHKHSYKFLFRCFCQVSFQGASKRTRASEGPNPQWNELVTLPFMPAGGDFSPSALKVKWTKPTTFSRCRKKLLFKFCSFLRVLDNHIQKRGMSSCGGGQLLANRSQIKPDKADVSLTV
jgi:hypothetical protein